MEHHGPRWQRSGPSAFLSEPRAHRHGRLLHALQAVPDGRRAARRACGGRERGPSVGRPRDRQRHVGRRRREPRRRGGRHLVGGPQGERARGVARLHARARHHRRLPRVALRRGGGRLDEHAVGLGEHRHRRAAVRGGAVVAARSGPLEGRGRRVFVAVDRPGARGRRRRGAGADARDPRVAAGILRGAAAMDPEQDRRLERGQRHPALRHAGALQHVELRRHHPRGHELRAAAQDGRDGHAGFPQRAVRHGGQGDHRHPLRDPLRLVPRLRHPRAGAGAAAATDQRVRRAAQRRQVHHPLRRRAQRLHHAALGARGGADVAVGLGHRPGAELRHLAAQRLRRHPRRHRVLHRLRHAEHAPVARGWRSRVRPGELAGAGRRLVLRRPRHHRFDVGRDRCGGSLP
mmetsp:Transcript_6906/g.22091  ORF Transcript_6906/g.22091 Transcript_6906/m.22091 type:complete len:404 (+) Transcript_6906:612-1823(+)